MTDKEYRSKSEMRRVEYMKANEMTHEELLARIDEKIESVESMSLIIAVPWRALRAVVNLHEPFNFTWGGETETACKCGEMYPCPTIRQIMESLK